MIKRCTLTYEILNSDEKYSPQGLKRLSPQLRQLQDLPWSAEEQRMEARQRAAKLSIQGIQAKLSARLSLKRACFEPVDQNGKFILKPQSEVFPELPQNEDLSMHLAEGFGLEVPLHGLIWSADDSLTYLIKRFDRAGHRQKIATEDFAQLLGKNREQKYAASMEQVASVLDRYCSFPVLEKIKLFRRSLFNFLIGNEDMHLKNFSLITRQDKIELSPVYDLLNTTAALSQTQEEIALSLRGKKNKLKVADWIDYYAMQSLGLRKDQVDTILQEAQMALKNWPSWIEKSFLSEKMKDRYREIVRERAKRLGLEAFPRSQ